MVVQNGFLANYFKNRKNLFDERNQTNPLPAPVKYDPFAGINIPVPDLPQVDAPKNPFSGVNLNIPNNHDLPQVDTPRNPFSGVNLDTSQRELNYKPELPVVNAPTVFEQNADKIQKLLELPQVPVPDNSTKSFFESKAGDIQKALGLPTVPMVEANEPRRLGNIVLSDDVLPPIPSISPMGNTNGKGLVDATNETLADSSPVIPAPPPLNFRPSQITQGKISKIENKQYGFQRDENGNILRDENGKPLYQKDRDTDHNWWDVVKSAGLGFAHGGLSGAIGGAVGGAIDRNFDEKAIDDIKLQSLNDKFANQMKREDAELGREYKRKQIENIDFDNETQRTAAETRKQTAEQNSLLRQVKMLDRYKRGANPTFDARLDAAGIELPDFERGKKMKPRYWNRDTGTQMTFDDQNRAVPVLDVGSNPIVSEAEKNVMSGGYSVRPNVARTVEGQIETSQINAGNQTTANKREYEVEISKLDSQINSSNKAVAGINKRLNEINALTGLEKLNAADERKSLLKELRDEEAELAGYQTRRKNLPAPVEVQSRTGGGSVFTEQQARDYYTKQGVAAAEIERRIQAGKTQGIIK